MTPTEPRPEPEPEPTPPPPPPEEGNGDDNGDRDFESAFRPNQDNVTEGSEESQERLGRPGE